MTTITYRAGRPPRRKLSRLMAGHAPRRRPDIAGHVARAVAKISLASLISIVWWMDCSPAWMTASLVVLALGVGWLALTT